VVGNRLGYLALAHQARFSEAMAFVNRCSYDYIGPVEITDERNRVLCESYIATPLPRIR
jgi:hypothetical protein